MITQYVEEARFNRIRVESLDALRGFLSILVCIAHAWQIFVSHFEHGTTTTYFLLGVIARGAVLCFFCLSGYVITLSIEKNIKRNNGFNLSDYVSARFWRIVPPLLVVMVITLTLSFGLEFLGADKIPDSVAAARHLYETNFPSQLGCLISACAYGDLTGKGLNGPLWTLALEIQLYAISGVLAWLVLSAKKVSYRLLGAFLFVIYVSHVLKLSHGFVLNTQVVSYACYFFGAMMCLFHLRLNKVNVMILVGVLSLLTASTGFFANYKDLSANMESSSWLLFQLFVGGLLSFAIIWVAKAGMFDRWAAMGKYSYTLYIFHFPWMVFVYFVTFHFAPEFLSNYYILIFFFSVIAVILLTKKIGLFIEQSQAQRDFFRKSMIRYLPGSSFLNIGAFCSRKLPAERKKRMLL
jgi:peptidoglycan/LPS O-acetylase OafA/YrhL